MLFANYLGFHHRRITPLWPKANGEAERFMRTIGKVIKAAQIDKNWKQELYKFLRNYRATPHSTTGVPPAQALFGKVMVHKNQLKHETKVFPEVFSFLMVQCCYMMYLPNMVSTLLMYFLLNCSLQGTTLFLLEVVLS
jgi:hypothetical protein